MPRTHAPGSAMRGVWWLGTVGVTVGITAFVIAASPAAGASPDRALRSVVFLGSGVHVAATAWFFTVPDVRRYALQHPRRYIVAPIALVAATAVLAMAIPVRRFWVVLLPYFIWQYFHYQKQNVGMASLAGVSNQTGPTPQLERHCIVGAGVAGIAGLVCHPELLGLAIHPPIRWMFHLAEAAFIVIVIVGIWAWTRRPPAQRSFRHGCIYLLTLLFFAPIFLFHSPYAAAVSFATAHGFQYLLIVGLVAGSTPRGADRATSLALLTGLALLGGWALDHGSKVAQLTLTNRAVFGAYLGLVMAHFVIDAGLWRLRDEFPRRFLTARIPYLLKPAAPTDAAPAVVPPEQAFSRSAR